MIGKEIRLAKLVNPVSKRACFVPLDHAITIGPVNGLDNTVSTIQRIGIENVNAYIVHKGVLFSLSGHPEVYEKCQFILHLSASTCLGQKSVSKYLVSTVEEAVKYGAMGVSVHVNLGNDFESQMVKDLGQVSKECMEWGMPLLAMMYVKNNQDFMSFDAGAIGHAARVAQELGADMVKIACPNRIQDIHDIVQRVQIPVLVSGGEKMDNLRFLRNIAEALEAGASGVSVGRNIFQAKKSDILMSLVSDLVQKKIDFQRASERYKEEYEVKM